jgi:hypothetical protein
MRICGLSVKAGRYAGGLPPRTSAGFLWHAFLREGLQVILRLCPGKIIEPIQQICLTGTSLQNLSIPTLKNILIYRKPKAGPYS